MKKGLHVLKNKKKKNQTRPGPFQKGTQRIPKIEKHIH